MSYNKIIITNYSFPAEELYNILRNSIKELEPSELTTWEFIPIIWDKKFHALELRIKEIQDIEINEHEKV